MHSFECDIYVNYFTEKCELIVDRLTKRIYEGKFS